jgi:hypothetical protein
MLLANYHSSSNSFDTNFKSYFVRGFIYKKLQGFPNCCTGFSNHERNYRFGDPKQKGKGKHGIARSEVPETKYSVFDIDWSVVAPVFFTFF